MESQLIIISGEKRIHSTISTNTLLSQPVDVPPPAKIVARSSNSHKQRVIFAIPIPMEVPQQPIRKSQFVAYFYSSHTVSSARISAIFLILPFS